jgi:hypothetical protein
MPEQFVGLVPILTELLFPTTVPPSGLNFAAHSVARCVKNSSTQIVPWHENYTNYDVAV